MAKTPSKNSDALSKLRELSKKKSGGQTKKQEKRSTTSLFREAVEEQDNAKSAVEIDVVNSEIYQILVDNSIESEQKIEQIAEKLTFDFADTENESQNQNLLEIRAIVRALIADFTNQNRESIELTKQNPLSKLTESIREVFENYNDLTKGRDDLKGKLAIIQGWIDEKGGEEELIKALSQAQDKKEEKLVFEKAKNDAEGELQAATARAERLDTDIIHTKRRAERIKPKFWQGALKREKRELEDRAEQLSDQKTEAFEDLAEKKEAFEAASGALDEFMKNSEYEIYERILEILDIGSEEFRDVLKAIAEKTLQYVDDTENTLTGVRDQLEELLGDVNKGLDVSVNSREKISILGEALAKAEKTNTKNFKEFRDAKKAEAEAPVAGLAQLGEFETKKVIDNANDYTSELSRSVHSITSIRGNITTHETTLVQLRTDLQNGLSDAESQLLDAVAAASATGRTMLNRAQRLGTLAQSVVSKGMYKQELRDVFDGAVKDFEADLSARLARNEDIHGFTEAINSLSEALDTKNEGVIQIATEQRELVEKLKAGIEELQASNDNAKEIDRLINEAAYEENNKPESGAPVPAAG